MRFNCDRLDDRAAARDEARARWHRWYAWRPVRVGKNDCRWFEWVERRVVYVGLAYDGSVCWDVGYRPPPPRLP